MEERILEFRPCIDLHQGKVKQIVGETLQSGGGDVVENFVSEHDSAYYAGMFKEDGLTGGHVIMLGGGNEEAAVRAIEAYPGGLQIGGGITAENAAYYLERGASHVIVTSYIFRDGRLDDNRLRRIVSEIGKERLVIDLSCRKQEGGWYVATNQWKTISDFEVRQDTLEELGKSCSEFLVHAVDVEGKRSGIQQELVRRLAEWTVLPTTYAGGVRSLEDVELFRKLGRGKLHLTIGSALDIFGGTLPYRDVVAYCRTGGKRR
jgi:phosphoribosylformimino-5-aminoimidazole carboxamide ribotide isomerase